MKVFILRGIPGSGKSTWVEEYCHNLPPVKVGVVEGKVAICRADDYHINKYGIYEYKPENAKPAHDECFKKALAVLVHMPKEYSHLFIDNTNSSLWELSPYYRLAEALGHSVEIVQIDCPLEVSIRRNVHDVPSSTIWRMYQNILTEKLPPHYKLSIIPYRDNSK